MRINLVIQLHSINSEACVEHVSKGQNVDTHISITAVVYTPKMTPVAVYHRAEIHVYILVVVVLCVTFKLFYFDLNE